jgi:hypothetical protein
MTPYSARAMLDGDVVVSAKGCFASSENDPARESECKGQSVPCTYVAITLLKMGLKIPVPLLMKCHTPRTTTIAMAMIFMEERPVIKRDPHLTLYAFTKVKKAAEGGKIHHYDYSMSYYPSFYIMKKGVGVTYQEQREQTF